MGRFHDLCLVVWIGGVIVFPLIFLLLFFVPIQIFALVLSIDAFVVSLCNVEIQHPLNKERTSNDTNG